MKFEKWSQAAKSLKDIDNTTIDKVVEFFESSGIPFPKEALRKKWDHPLGFRKNNDAIDVGEQIIERLLLNVLGKTKEILIQKENGRGQIKLNVSDHNFPFASQREGQVIADAFGYIQPKNKKDRVRPVVIEVKDTNENPWFAVVENAIQVRLARWSLEQIEKHALRTSGTNKIRGAWGLIVAPKKYFEGSNAEAKDAALKLIHELQKKTEIRIMLTHSDELVKKGNLIWVGGYNPDKI